MNDLYWIGPALVSGLLAVRLGLPPLVGYLIAGFILNTLGFVDHDRLVMVGNLGVTLLLFTIGLKLDVRSLLRPVIWAGTTLHMLVVIAAFGSGIYWLSLTGLAVFADVDIRIALLIGFALSFSSTVFAVKTLEEKGEYTSKYGQLAIGVLIMQDIYAVLFLVVADGKVPSLWAFALLGLIPLRGMLMNLMGRAGHGELQILFGLALGFGGWSLFDMVDVKGDLGALVVGALLAAHPAAAGMSKKLLGFKDLLLVGFFLSIGMSGTISVSALLVALGLAVLVVLKVILFFGLFTRFRLRAHTSLYASLVLANYSEFGLIVGAIAVANGYLSGDWLVIIALALTLTFIMAAPLNARSREIKKGIRGHMTPFETATLLPEDVPFDTGEARIAIIGMGRIGTGAYETLQQRYGDRLIGIDIDPDTVSRHADAGHNVILADVTDDEFWARTGKGKISVALLTLPEHEQNLCVARRINSRPNVEHVFAVVKHPEEVA
ncbi:MAG: potassium transporter Kef, partial [Gammaproteobacteria bacterium]|nr:potassium transporter Kef [Gammaproteobacteria bacterium]